MINCDKCRILRRRFWDCIWCIMAASVLMAVIAAGVMVVGS